MNFRDLHYLVTVADSGQFARAARLCNVSQPSLSIQLKKLEETLGITLFERGGRQLLVTQAAIPIIEQARFILQETAKLKEMAKATSGKGMEFRLGLIPTVAPYLLPQMMPAIRRAMPKVKFQFLEAQTHILEDMLARGALDGIVFSLPPDYTRFKSAALYTEACFVAVPLHHRLANRKQVKSSELASERMLLLDEGHCLRNQALTLCSREAMQDNANFRATSLETLRHMVAAGEGITIMPQTAVKRNDAIAYLHCSEAAFKRTIGLAWRHSTPHVSVIKTLSKLRVFARQAKS